MILSIFTRPLFINPQAYLVIPELMLIHRSIPYDFSSNQYVFLVITSGQVEGKLLLAGKDYILHLDLYTANGNVVLGEFYLDGNQINSDSIQLELSNGMITISFGVSSESKYLKLNVGKLNVNKLLGEGMYLNISKLNIDKLK